MKKLSELVVLIPRADTAMGEVAYQLDDSFFNLFANSLLEKGELAVAIHFTRTPGHIQLRFNISGQVELSCDRTLEIFDYPIQVEQEVYFKFGEETKELGLDLYMIEREASSIEVGQHIYDFVNLAIPMKRLHPRICAEMDEIEDLD